MLFTSTDSLPISQRSQTSVYTASSTHTLASDTDGLHRLLASKDVSTEIISGAFEEFAWRGILRGTRVRDWCEGLRTLLEELHIVQDLYSALQSPSIIALYPFLSLISTPSDIQAHFFYTPPSLSPAQLGSIDRDTLVDALLSLVEGMDFVSEQDLFAPVAELVLEYIGAVWRRLASEGVRGSSAPAGIAKSLVELEYEMQSQGNRSALRTLIFHRIRRIRFDLGFVTSFQLVSRLKSHAAQFTESHLDPSHVVTAWTLRRLNAGATPQRVYDELVFIRERVRDNGVQGVVEQVMLDLGLEKKDSGDETMGSGMGDTPTEGIPRSPASPSPSPSPSGFGFGRPLPPTPTNKKAFSLFNNKNNKKASRKTMIALKPTSASRDPVIHAHSSFLDLPAGFNPDRRPSLPVLSSMSYPHLHANLSSPLKSSSLTSFQSVDSVESNNSQRSSNADAGGGTNRQTETSDLLSQIMTFSEASDVRLILFDWVVEVRYRLYTAGEGDWFFGNGRESAANTLDTLEGRLVGKRDVMDLGNVFKEIRDRFGIPQPGSPIRMASRRRRRQPRGRSETTHGSRRESGYESSHQPSSPGHQGHLSESRGVSFELDSYYHRHIPEEDELDQEILAHTTAAATTSEADHDHDNDDSDLKTEESSSTETVKDGRRKSIGGASLFSLSSALSTSPAALSTRSGFANHLASPLAAGAGGSRTSFLSTYAFSIREAKVEYPHEAVAVDQARVHGHAHTQSRWEETLMRFPLPIPGPLALPESAPVPAPAAIPAPTQRSPMGTFFPSRSESSLTDPPHIASTATTTPSHRIPAPSLRHRRDNLHHYNLHIRTQPIPSGHLGHLGVPRPPSPADSFHSLLSALNLETHVPLDMVEPFPNPTLTPPQTPIGTVIPTTAIQPNQAPVQQGPTANLDRRRNNRQYVVLDHPELFDRYLHDLPEGEEARTPILEPSSTPSYTRRRHISTNSIPASISTLDSIDEFVSALPSSSASASRQRREELPLAQLFALFMDPSGPGGVAGTREGTRPEDVEKAVKGFVEGEMRYADEMGSGWDGEDQRRVIWLLRQIAVLIPDPALQYPIHQQILHLLRNPAAASSRTSLISTSSGLSSSTSATGSTGSTSKYLVTPHLPSRSTLIVQTTPSLTPETSLPVTPAIAESESETQGLAYLPGIVSRGSRESVGTFGAVNKGPFAFRSTLKMSKGEEEEGEGRGRRRKLSFV